MALTNATAAFIGASVTLFLVIVFMILMVILVKQCLAFLAKRNALRAQTEHQLQARRQLERQRRGSVTVPVPATFDWHHSIRIAGTPPPSYKEAKGLPSFDETVSPTKKKRGRRGRGGQHTDSAPPEVIVTMNRSATLVVGEGERENSSHRRHTSPNFLGQGGETTELQQNGGSSSSTEIELENQRNNHHMTSEGQRSEEVAVDVEVSESGEMFEVISGEEDTATVETNRSASAEHTTAQTVA
jgi:hypothetical protein